jgi:hypothetical protein
MSTANISTVARNLLVNKPMFRSKRGRSKVAAATSAELA